jgi:hypothetical protein
VKLLFAETRGVFSFLSHPLQNTKKTPQTLVTMNEPRMNLNEWSWHMSHEQVDDFDQPMLA